MKSIKEVVREERRRLYQIPGVHGIAIGPKIVAGEFTSELSIQILVYEKKNPSDIPSEELIPSHLSGIRTDVIQAGPVKPLFDDSECPEIDPDERTIRPLVGGIQIQPHGGYVPRLSYSGKGTLGCIVRTRGDSPQERILTNQHVLFSGTASGPSCSGCTAGSRVGQPTSSESSNKVGNVLIGKHTRLVDAGLATLDAGIQWKAEIEDIGRILGTERLTMERLLDGTLYPVRKRGAKTRLTHGIIASIEAEGRTDEPFNERDYDNSIMIYPSEFRSGNVCFSSSGDSGALVVNEANKVVGLLFGGQEMTVGDVVFHAGVACPIEDVLNELQVDLVHSQPEGHVFTVAAASEAERTESPAPSTMIVEEHIQMRENVQEDIFKLPNGAMYVSLFKNHENEVRYLLDNNRRVATVWHRNRGPSILHHLICCVQDKARRLPERIENNTWNDCAERILEGFQKYGSETLRNDINQVKSFFCAIGGLTYHQVLSQLEMKLAQLDVSEVGRSYCISDGST